MTHGIWNLEFEDPLCPADISPNASTALSNQGENPSNIFLDKSGFWNLGLEELEFEITEPETWNFSLWFSDPK